METDFSLLFLDVEYFTACFINITDRSVGHKFVPFLKYMGGNGVHRKTDKRKQVASQISML